MSRWPVPRGREAEVALDARPAATGVRTVVRRPWVGVGVVAGVVAVTGLTILAIRTCWVPGGVVESVFDRPTGQGMPNQDVGEEFFDPAGRSGFRVDQGGGWGDEVVEVFGGVGTDGVHPQLWWGGLPAALGILVAGGAGEMQHRAVRVGPHPPFRVVLENVMPFTVGIDIFWGGFPTSFGVPVVEPVPVIELAGMTEQQKRAYVLADNKLALNAGWDDDLLRLELG